MPAKKVIAFDFRSMRNRLDSQFHDEIVCILKSTKNKVKITNYRVVQVHSAYNEATKTCNTAMERKF